MKIEALAFVHGHTHAGHIDRKRTFLLYRWGVPKSEYFEDKKPEGAWPQVGSKGKSLRSCGTLCTVVGRSWAAGFCALWREVISAGISKKAEDIQEAHPKAPADIRQRKYTLEAFALARAVGSADEVESGWPQFTEQGAGGDS